MVSSGLQQLEQIPGAGYTIARDMPNIGIHSIVDFKSHRSWLVRSRVKKPVYHNYSY